MPDDDLAVLERILATATDAELAAMARELLPVLIAELRAWREAGEAARILPVRVVNPT